MKRLLIASALVLASTSASAVSWEQLSTFGSKEIKPSAEYTVDTAGWNVRVYEWVPAHNKNYRCIFAGCEKKGGVACYPAATSKPVYPCR